MPIARFGVIASGADCRSKKTKGSSDMKIMKLLFRCAAVWLVLSAIEHPEYLLAAIAFFILMGFSFLRWLFKDL